MSRYSDLKPAPNADAATVLIEQIFKQGRQDQGLRELTMNEFEAAGATTVIDTAIRLAGYGEEGGIKRAFVGDGEGMAPELLATYLGALFSGKKSTSVDGNFNTGGRATVLPLNPLGVIWASWTEGDSVGAMIHLARDPETGRYTKMMFDNEDGTLSEIGIPDEDLRHPLIEAAGHGTVVILLGETPEDHTVGEIRRNPDKTLVYPAQRYTQGDRLYFNAKYYELPKGPQLPRGITLKVKWANNDLEGNWKKDIAPGEWYEDAVRRTRTGGTATGSSYTFRTIQGVKDRVEKYAVEDQGGDHGTVGVLSRRGYPATIHWALFPESKYERFTEEGGGASDTTDYGVPLGLFGELKGGTTPDGKDYTEVYAMAYHGDARRPMEQYGIVNKELRDRMVIMVEPGGASARFVGAVPSGSRSHLVIEGGENEGRLPHEEWGAAFAKKMPKPIQDRLNDLNKVSESRAQRDKKLKDKLTDWFKRRTRVKDIGDITGDTDEGDGSTGGRGNKPSGGTPNPGGGTPCPEGCTCGKHTPSPRSNYSRPRGGTIGGRGFKADRDEATAASFATIPQVEWVGANEFTDGQESLLARCVTGNTYFLNREHPYFVAVFDEEIRSRPVAVSGQVRAFIEQAIIDHVVSQVMSMKLYQGSALVPPGSIVSRGYVDSALSDEAISASLLNMVTMQAILSGAFRGHAGFKRLDGSEDEAAA